MALGDVDKRGGLAPSELLSSLESSVSYVGGGAVAVRSTPSPLFGYVRVLGMSPPGGSVTPVATPYKANQSSFAMPPQPIPCGTTCMLLCCEPPFLCERGIGILGCIALRSPGFCKTLTWPCLSNGEQGIGLV